MVSPAPDFMPLSLKGLVIHPDNAFKVDFLMDTGNTDLKGPELQQEALKMMKYFLTALTMPEQDLWVNLSPYEKGKIVENNFGRTLMGRDLLAEDYVLKQLTASLIYPEDAIGKKFWAEVYQKAQRQLGTTEIPVNTFNKVWIVPSEAVVWEHEGKVIIVKSRLKVMLEEDYLSLKNHSGVDPKARPTHSLASQVVREVVIPVLEKQVNGGEHFDQLRQMFQAMILATWYKKALKESIVTRVYANQKKIKGVDNANTSDIESIYRQYLKAFKKGAFNYIKEDLDPATGQVIPRKYFSGGFSPEFNGKTSFDMAEVVWKESPSQLSAGRWAAISRASRNVGSAILVEGGVSDIPGKVSVVGPGKGQDAAMNVELPFPATLSRYILDGYQVHSFHWDDKTESVGLLETSRVLHRLDVPSSVKESHVFNGYLATYVRYLFESTLGPEAIKGELSELLTNFENASRSRDMGGAIISLDAMVSRLMAAEGVGDRERPGDGIRKYEEVMNESNRYWNTQANFLNIDSFVARKYGEDSHIQPLPGITFIQWIGPQIAFYRQLSEFVDEFRLRLEKEGLLQYVNILSPDRFHMTVANIAVDTNKELEQTITEAARNAINDLSGQGIHKLKMFAAGVSVTAAMSLSLRVHPLREDDLTEVYKIRNGMHKYLQPLGQEGDTANPWIGHITLAYIFKNIPEPDFIKLQGILHEYENRFVGEFESDNIDIRTFKDMETWSGPLVTLHLSDAAMLADDGTLLGRLHNATTSISDGNLAEARIWYEKMLQADQRNTDALNGLARIDLENGNADQAREAYERVLNIDSNNAEALEGLVSIEFQLGHGEQAWKLYQELSSKDRELGKYEEPMLGSNGYFNKAERIRELRIPRGARDKYEENGTPKDMPGITAVQWIERGTLQSRQLSAFAKELRDKLESLGLLSYFAFLPADTYHMTLYDIDTWEGDAWRTRPWANTNEDKTRAVTEIVGKVTEGVKQVFEGLTRQKATSAKMFTAGLSLSAGTSLVLRTHPESREDLQKALKVRNALKSLLPLGVGKDNNFIGHISLAYIVKDIPEADYQKVQEVLREYENRFVGEFNLEQIELREFASMEHWKNPSQTLSLTPDIDRQIGYKTAIKTWKEGLTPSDRELIFGKKGPQYINGDITFRGLRELSGIIQQGRGMAVALKATENGLIKFVRDLIEQGSYGNQAAKPILVYMDGLYNSTLSPERMEKAFDGYIVALTSSDKAMLDPRTGPNNQRDLGGIALNAEMLNLQIKRDGNGVLLPISRQSLGKINIQGFTPVIIDIKSVNLPELLGLGPRREEQTLAKL